MKRKLRYNASILSLSFILLLVGGTVTAGINNSNMGEAEFSDSIYDAIGVFLLDHKTEVPSGAVVGQVPAKNYVLEPAMLMLLGLGLVGFVVVVRMRIDSN
ncbi:MAG: PEP-CTERM sorting domain-containing protein [Desulfatitalea sp.]|nr:PEP-CTERM sorting domain-containing protein [Desulfatitalea sp.]